jgi:hypothetical protein
MNRTATTHRIGDVLLVVDERGNVGWMIDWAAWPCLVDSGVLVGHDMGPGTYGDVRFATGPQFDRSAVPVEAFEPSRH